MNSPSQNQSVPFSAAPPTSQSLFQLKGTTFIHWNPDRIDYAISEQELEALIAPTDAPAKEFFLLCVGVLIPCGINSLVEWWAFKGDEWVPTVSFVVNLVFFAIPFLGALYFGRTWYIQKKVSKALVNKIKNRPKVQVS